MFIIFETKLTHTQGLRLWKGFITVKVSAKGTAQFAFSIDMLQPAQEPLIQPKIGQIAELRADVGLQFEGRELLLDNVQRRFVKELIMSSIDHILPHLHGSHELACDDEASVVEIKMPKTFSNYACMYAETSVPELLLGCASKRGDIEPGLLVRRIEPALLDRLGHY